ncbi:hypothetical protein [Actinomadura algeriensis]|uniref:Uncharacterized protein n=1 Tax=Actinomadura algeriensis TaxID=1679523 RepID=A0ABR9K357_9ACTN|nr:hypothetical protein [Actinomadura algeriensis]MBE1537029.1 hypothetical protein [Actinomadura algeriensis]
MLIDYLVQFSPESALLEISLQQRERFFRDVQRGAGLAEFTGEFGVACFELGGLGLEPGVLGLQTGRGQGAFIALFAPVLDMGVAELLGPQQRAAFGAALGQRVISGQDPGLVGL